MAQKTEQSLSDVAETLLFTLYIRAMESKRPDALLKDERAEALVAEMDYDFSRIEQIKIDEEDKVTLILRNQEFDRRVRAFLQRFPQATVVHIGCGLDTRFERVDNGSVQWYDLDLPEVMELRRQWIGDEGGRYHFLACSAFEPVWMDTVRARHSGPFFFVAEGVFMYFEEAQIKSLVMALQTHFPGAELVFDAFTPFLVRVNNLRFAVTNLGARYHWGLKRGEALESWSPGIALRDQWSYLDSPEPRLDHVRWMRHVPFLRRVMSVFHYRLGEDAPGR